jgi:hypothetical protein
MNYIIAKSSMRKPHMTVAKVENSGCDFYLLCGERHPN